MKNKNNHTKAASSLSTTGKHTAVSNNNTVQMRRNRSRRNGRKNSSGTDDNVTSSTSSANNNKSNSKNVFRKPRTSKQSFSSERDDDEDDINSTTNEVTAEDDDNKTDLVDDGTQHSNQYDNEVNGQESMSSSTVDNVDNIENAVDESPAKPGTIIKLHGVVLHETTGGLIVLNVRWRNKIYSGALIDVEKTKWAGERISKENTTDLMIGLKPSTAKPLHTKRGKRSWDERNNEKVANNNNNGNTAECTATLLDNTTSLSLAAVNADPLSHDIKTEFTSIKQEQSTQSKNNLSTPPNGICQKADSDISCKDSASLLSHLQQRFDDCPSDNDLTRHSEVQSKLSYIDVTSQPKSPDSLTSNNDGSGATNSADGSVDVKIDVESNDPPVIMPTSHAAPSIIVQDCTTDDNTDMLHRQDITDIKMENSLPLTTEQLRQFQHPDYYRCSSLMPRYMADIAQMTPNLNVLDSLQMNHVISDTVLCGHAGEKNSNDFTSAAMQKLQPEVNPWKTSVYGNEKITNAANERLVIEEDLIQASDDENSEVPTMLPGLSHISVAVERKSFEKWKEKMEMLFPDSAEVDPERRRLKMSLLLNSDEECNEEDHRLLLKLRQKAAEQIKNEDNMQTGMVPPVSDSPPKDVISQTEGTTPPNNNTYLGADDNVMAKQIVNTIPQSSTDIVKESPNKSNVDLIDTPTPVSDSKSIHNNSTENINKPLQDLNQIRDISLPPQLVPDVRVSGIEPRGVPFLQPNISAGRPITRLINKPESITGNTSFRTSNQNNQLDDQEISPSSTPVNRASEAVSDEKKSAVSVDFTKLKQSVADSVDARLTTPIITERTYSRPMPTTTVMTSGLPSDSNVMERTLIGAKTWIPQEVYSQSKVKLLGELPFNDASRKRRSPVLSNERNEGIPQQWKSPKVGNTSVNDNTPQQNQYRLVDGRPYPGNMHSFTIGSKTEPIGFVPALSNHGGKTKQNITVASTRTSQHPVPIAPAPLPMNERSKPERELPIPMDHDGPQMSRFTFTHDKKLVPSPMENRGRPRKVRVAVTQQIPIGKPQDVEISRGVQPIPNESIPPMRKQPVTSTGSNSVRTSVIHGRGRMDGSKSHEEISHASPVRGKSPHDVNMMEGDSYYVKDKRMKLDILDKTKHFHKSMGDLSRGGERVLHPMKVVTSEDHRNVRSPVASRSPNDLVKRQASPSMVQGLAKSPGDIRSAHSPMHGQWNRGGHPFVVNPMIQQQMGYSQGSVPFSSYFVGHPYQQGGANRGSPRPSGKEHPSPPTSDIKDLHAQHEMIAKQKQQHQQQQDIKLPPSEFFAYDPKYPPQAHIEALRSGGGIVTSSPSNFPLSYPRRVDHVATLSNSTGDLHVYDRTANRSPSRSSSDLTQHQIRHSRGAAGPYHPPSATSTGPNSHRLDQRPDIGSIGRPSDAEIARRVHLQQPGHHLSPLVPGQPMAYHEKGPFMTSQGQRGSGLLSNNLILSRADGHYVGPVNYDQRQLEKKR